MAKKFNLAVIGAGMWGKTHIKMFGAEGRANITWVVDAVPAAAEAAQKTFKIPNAGSDPAAALADPAVDAVVVASPPFTHRDLAIAVLRAGKHLLIEKPMAIRPEDGQAIADEAARHPELVSLEGSCRHARLNPKFRFVKAMIESGKLGRVYHIHHHSLGQGTFVEYNPNGAWAMDKRYAGGGPFLDWGVYDLSFHLGILGDRPQLQSLRSFTISGLRDLSALAPVVDVEMHGAAYMEFDGGLTYYYERGGGVHGAAPNQTRIYGTEGGLHFAYTSWDGDQIEYFYSDSQPRHETLKVDMSGHPKSDNEPFVAHFLDCLEGKATPAMPVQLAAKHLNILFQILGG